MSITLSDTQVALLREALRPGSEARVWSVLGSRRATVAALHRYGLADQPQFGARLTPAGEDIARQLKTHPQRRVFDLPAETKEN